MKKLKAPIGADGANIGTRLYPLDADGNITVPDDAAQTLVGVGGFQLIADIPGAPEGHTVLLSTNGPQSCSHGSDSFSTDENGYVTVPTSMVGALLSHGFAVPTPAIIEGAEQPEPAQADAEAVDIPQIPFGTQLEAVQTSVETSNSVAE
ncbi:hypothetical protein A6U86_05490 [Rhizobium sp. AC27/96]|uniref:hypothetical protein n=1 Tax=Rhizobium sp. AC27/96 TaxID=1841653 RepID=UPI000828BEC8|nr:hypothetical protein [Rhizobium sp. AC27/96]OCJ12476.1 hypothetical protein A6U86_05490 [Rhizobium sp. AC27/96]